MRPEDKPIWYNVYKAFPPKLEPRYDRPATQMDVIPIFYKEDQIRARFHKEIRQTQTIHFNSLKTSETQMFIEIYNKLAAQGPLSDDKIFETAVEMLNENLNQLRLERTSGIDEIKSEDMTGTQTLSQSFAFASDKKGNKTNQDTAGTSIDVKDLFKD